MRLTPSRPANECGRATKLPELACELPSWVVLPSVNAIGAPHPTNSVLEFFVHRFPYVSSATWAQRFESGLVRDKAGRAVAGSQPFAPLAGQKLSYFRVVDDELESPFHEQIVFEDENIVVADKPHFLPVQPAGRYLTQTLLSRLQKRLKLPELTPAHRIDQGTAGLVLLVKQPELRGAYQRLFREHAIIKTYQAIAPFRADLAFPMLRQTRIVDAAHFMQMQEVAGCANSETELDLLERSPKTPELWARYQLKPRTGKRHQLRVQMSALGIPIQNDPIYPELLAQPDELDFTRPLKLLAQGLAFVDPVSGVAQQFASGLTLNFDEYADNS